MAAAWNLTQAQRDDTIARVSSNIFTMGFIKGLPITDEQAHRAAETFEQKAYTAALVASRTTTGNRPLSETTNTYARWVWVILQCLVFICWLNAVGVVFGCSKLAELVVDMIKNNGKFEADPVAVSGSGEVRIQI